MSSHFQRLPRGEVASRRVSDEQRDAVCDTLAEHYAEGRISLEELERRTELVLASDGHAQLSRLTADLPRLPGQAVGPSFLRILGWALGALGTGIIAAVLFFIGMGLLIFGAGHWWVVSLIGLLFGSLSAAGWWMVRRDAQRRRQL